MRTLLLSAAVAAALVIVAADAKPAAAQVIVTNGYYAPPVVYRAPVYAPRGVVQPFATPSGGGIPGTYGWSLPGTYGWSTNAPLAPTVYQPVYTSGYRGYSRGWRR